MQFGLFIVIIYFFYFLIFLFLDSFFIPVGSLLASLFYGAIAFAFFLEIVWICVHIICEDHETISVDIFLSVLLLLLLFLYYCSPLHNIYDYNPSKVVINEFCKKGLKENVDSPFLKCIDIWHLPTIGIWRPLTSDKYDCQPFWPFSAVLIKREHKYDLWEFFRDAKGPFRNLST